MSIIEVSKYKFTDFPFYTSFSGVFIVYRLHAGYPIQVIPDVHDRGRSRLPLILSRASFVYYCGNLTFNSASSTVSLYNKSSRIRPAFFLNRSVKAFLSIILDSSGYLCIWFPALVLNFTRLFRCLVNSLYIGKNRMPILR